MVPEAEQQRVKKKRFFFYIHRCGARSGAAETPAFQTSCGSSWERARHTFSKAFLYSNFKKETTKTKTTNFSIVALHNESIRVMTFENFFFCEIASKAKGVLKIQEGSQHGLWMVGTQKQRLRARELLGDEVCVCVSLSVCTHTYTRMHTHTHTLSLFLSLTHSLTLSLTHRGLACTCCSTCPTSQKGRAWQLSWYPSHPL